MSPSDKCRGWPQSSPSCLGRRMLHVEGGDASISILSPLFSLGWHKAEMASGIGLDVSGSSCTSLWSTGGATVGGCHQTTCSFAKVTLPSSASSGLRHGKWRRSVSFKSAFKAGSRRKFSAGCVVCETKEAPVGVVNDKTFKEEVLGSETVVLVDFWAPWCGPCRMLDPVIESIAGKYKGKVKCVKVNTDDCSKTATELGIRSIPTCMIFKGGERLDTVIGCVPETTLIAVLDKYIAT